MHIFRSKFFVAIAAAAVVSAVAAGAGLYKDELKELFVRLPAIEKAAQGLLVNTPRPSVFAPEPLRSGARAPRANLTVDGVLQWTNTRRLEGGLRPLKGNAKLNQAAALKLQDMFDKQYFAHDSPTGEGVTHWVTVVRYEYASVGENLALGNFASDEALVDAWMASPGHRENILNITFSEIGIAVGRGKFEGETVWLAVQEFGMPLSACPEPDETLLATIEANKAQLAAWENELAERRADIEATEPKYGSEYEQKTDEYNALVRRYNDLLTVTRALVDRYNAEVSKFNDCLAG